MAITRRQFVTRLGTLAAAAGFSQADVSRIAEAFAYGTTTGKTNLGGALGKPTVIWVHGAECTGCSTSLLGIFEDSAGTAIVGTTVTTGAALGLAGVLPTELTGPDLTYHALGLTSQDDYTDAQSNAQVAFSIADLVVDVVDLQYHETVMGMGGDLAAQWLDNFMATQSTSSAPFVLVVEGALQPIVAAEQAWGASGAGATPWCSIGIKDDTDTELELHDVVWTLATRSKCIGIIPIGQCATYGGYPGTKSKMKSADAGFDVSKTQTNAMGVYAYLTGYRVGQTGPALGDTPTTAAVAASKVVNVPGCPTNPWWFVLTVVCFLIDTVNGSRPLSILDGAGIPRADAVDSGRRLKKVYGTPIHGPACPRYQDYVNGAFALKPGQAGCLQKLGCKGPATNSLCGVHGWNNVQPQNTFRTALTDPVDSAGRGTHCTRAGHPCMACTEAGYPNSFVPFVVRS